MGAHGLLAVGGLHEDLVQQRDFLQELLHRAFDHLGDDVGGLAGFGGLLGGNAALLLDQIGRDVGARQRSGLHRGDVHGDVLGGDVVTFELDDHADAGAVQVRSQLAAGVALEAADRHVLADLADQALAHVFHGRAEAFLGQRQGRQGGHVSGVLFSHQASQRAHESQEGVVLRDEVGLAVHFDQRAVAADHGRGDDAFGSDARGGLASLVAQLDAQDLFSAAQVAVGLGQRLLAFHHRGVGASTQFAHHACGDSSHISSPDFGWQKGPRGPFQMRGRKGSGLFGDLDELVAGRGNRSQHFVRGVGLAFEHGVSNGAGVQSHSLGRVVVAGDDVVDAHGRVVRVHHADDGNAELLGFGDGNLVIADVDDEDGVGQRGHVLDAADVLFQLGDVTLEHQRFLLDRGLGAGVDLGLHVLQVLEGRLDRLEVGHHAAEPTGIDVGHAGAQGFRGDDLTGLTLRADHQDRAALGSQRADELQGILERGQRLFQVDDVDLVAMAVDIRGHLGVPEAGLVTEMDTGFQHLAHRDRHGSYSEGCV
eukprot:m.12180 g.12180  ORF g.12180 m.12180 type:complete len:537 (-) comp17340_c0_seq1:210-1820(-)